MEHNVSEVRGFTLRYRPWILIHTESYVDKESAIAREKFFKTGRGREEFKFFISNYLNSGAVSAAAEKDENSCIGKLVRYPPQRKRMKILVSEKMVR